MPEKQNNLNCTPKVTLASEQSKKGTEVRNATLSLHLKQLQESNNSTKDQNIFSVLTGTNKAEKTVVVTVQPVSPWRAQQAIRQGFFTWSFLASPILTHTHTPGSIWRKQIPSFPKLTMVLSGKSCFYRQISLRGHRWRSMMVSVLHPSEGERQLSHFREDLDVAHLSGH